MRNSLCQEQACHMQLVDHFFSLKSLPSLVKIERSSKVVASNFNIRDVLGLT